SRASTPCSREYLSMISPYGTTGWATAASGGATTGSGYGTSSGAKRTIADASSVISPPLRNVSTSELPSMRCDLTDSSRPFAKNASSANACTGLHTMDARVTNKTSSGVIPRAKTRARSSIVLFLTMASLLSTAGVPPILPRVDEGMKHAHAQLSRILAVGRRHQRRHIRFVDDEPQLGVIAGAQRVRFERNLFQLLFA